jgi:hypothetical protein
MKNPLREYGLFGWNYAHLLTHPWKIAEESYYHVKWFIQRGHRGYADCDVWNLNYYLAGWMPAAIRRLEMKRLGHPIGMTTAGWKTRLRIMREGFEAVIATSDFPDAKRYRQLERQMNEGLNMFAKHFLSLWD